MLKNIFDNDLSKLFKNLSQAGPVFYEAVKRGNFKVLKSLLGPAFNGLVLQTAKAKSETEISARYSSYFDWEYKREFPAMKKLYEAAKVSQWNGSTDLPWETDVDPLHPDYEFLPDEYMPISQLDIWSKLSKREKQEWNIQMLCAYTIGVEFLCSTRRRGNH